MSTLRLSPLFRHAVGFDRVADLLERTLNEGTTDSQTYPPYNITKLGENSYCITMAVAGFSQNELQVVMQENEVIISGKIQEKAKEEAEFLYKGIATRSFQRRFSLSDYMKVTGAQLENGLLNVYLARRIPESMKPVTIEIQGADKQASNLASVAKN